MVKTIIGFIFSYLIQDFIFPVDESGKYTLSEVVEVHELSKDKLYKNGIVFMKKIDVLNKKKNPMTKDPSNYFLQKKGSFVVYKIGSLKKHVDGAVEYDITLEFKDEKYRYTISNFMFTPYRRNRYGKFEPIKGKYTPLEMEVSKLNRKNWDNYRKEVYEKSRGLIRNLHEALIFDRDDQTPIIKKEENW